MEGGGLERGFEEEEVSEFETDRRPLGSKLCFDQLRFTIRSRSAVGLIDRHPSQRRIQVFWK